MGVNRPLQLLAPRAERRRGVKRHVDATNRTKRQAIERDVDVWGSCVRSDYARTNWNHEEHKELEVRTYER